MKTQRDIITIDEALCNGCGQCVLDCAEGALRIVDGKARLVGEVLCDGLGACLAGCPTGALKVISREAEPFDEQAVAARQAAKPSAPPSPGPLPAAGGCPGHAAMSLAPARPAEAGAPQASTLGHWPIKLQLLAPGAPFLQGADLLLLADCAAAACPDLHARLLAGKVVALACPKLDDPAAHLAKLVQVLAGARPRSLTVVHMEVPCCTCLNVIARRALAEAGLALPVEEVVVARDGRVLSDSRDGRAA